MIYTFILVYALGNISGIFTALFVYLRLIDGKGKKNEKDANTIQA